MTTKVNNERFLPKELIELVKEAMESNITKEEFRGFMEGKRTENEDKS